MKPLILNFLEKPPLSKLETSMIEYSKDLNLSVVKGTKTPAITYVNLDTNTFTKTEGEDSDSDKSSYLMSLLDTSTAKLTQNELTDSDNDFNSLMKLMDTKTITESVEVSDSDR